MSTLEQRAREFLMTHEWERRPDGLRDLLAEFARLMLKEALGIAEDSRLRGRPDSHLEVARRISKLAE